MSKRKESASEITEQEVELNRKHERLRQRDIEQHRRLYLGVGIAIALAVVFMVIGLFNEFYLSPRRVVATAAGQQILARDFAKRATMEQADLTNLLRMYAIQEQQFGNQGIFTSQINQLQATLASPFAMGQETLDRMIREIIVRQEAAARGIEVSDQEVDDAIREEVAGGLGLVTAPQATATAEAGANATATATLWTPTPEPTADISVSAGLTETEGVTDTAEISATATPLPTPAPARVITDTGYTDGLVQLENSLRATGGFTLAEYREIVRSRLLEEKLAEAIGEDDVAATEDAVEARHILISEIAPTATPTEIPEGDPTPEPTATATALPAGAPTPTATPAPRDREQALALAQELRQRLVDGEDFATLAAEFSDDTGSGALGGDLGWFGHGAMVAPFEDAAFALPVGEISEPISTTFGYHLIEVTEKDAEHPKEEQTLQQERATAFNEWMTAQIAAANVERGDVTSALPRNMQ